jgi:Zn-dependent M16 (insulinase) family peptidase
MFEKKIFQFEFLILHFFWIRSVTESGTEVFDILAAMSQLLLRAENVVGVALNMTENHKSDFVRQAENFVENLPRSESNQSPEKSAESETKLETNKTFVATPFPVHYCGLVLPTVPYSHEDSAPLRILAKLLTSKLLLPEIREKGGAYGGGATSSATSGTLLNLDTKIIAELILNTLKLNRVKVFFYPKSQENGSNEKIDMRRCNLF